MISVLILVRNEIRNLADCLASVTWSDDVVVVDSGSTDGTPEKAAALGTRVVQFRWNGELPKKKNWALENVSWKNEWVLILDADERITPELAVEMQNSVKQPKVDGYFVNRRFIFLGKWIQHCGYYPSWNLRLFRHAKGRYEKFHVRDTAAGDNEIHEHVVLNGTAAHLKSDMLHFAYPDIYTWMEKHNRYSNWEAEVEVGAPGTKGEAQRIGQHLEKRRALREWSRRMPFRPALRFFYSYILKRGFLDGREGFILCRLLAVYEMLNVYKALELRRRKNEGNEGGG